MLAVAPSFTYTALSQSLNSIAMRRLALLARILVETAAETTDVTDDVEYVAATTDGSDAISTSPMLLLPAGNAVETVTGIAVWLLAIATGKLFAIVFWPTMPVMSPMAVIREPEGLTFTF